MRVRWPTPRMQVCKRALRVYAGQCAGHKNGDGSRISGHGLFAGLTARLTAPRPCEEMGVGYEDFNCGCCEGAGTVNQSIERFKGAGTVKILNPGRVLLPE